MDDKSITRRGAIIAAAAGAMTLSGCSRKTETEKIAESNAAIIADLDLAQTRLPLGSVVETPQGRFMVTGHKCISFEDAQDGSRGEAAFDYYGTMWPMGIQWPQHEALSGLMFNASDISEVLFIGLVNEEDQDLRAYVDGVSWETYSPAAVKATAPAYAQYSELAALEQQMRLQGVRSEELYGEAFDGGLLYSFAGSGAE